MIASTARLGPAALILAVFILTGCGGPPRQESITVFRSFAIPPDLKPTMVVNEVKEAMAARASNLTAITGVLPDPLPDQAGTFNVAVQQMAMPLGMSISFPTVKCDSPYSLITNSGGFSTGGSREQENYTGCVYPTKLGTVVHIVLVDTTSHSNGLVGMANAGVKSLLVGGNQDGAERHMDQITDAFLCKVPQAQVTRQSKEGATGGILIRGEAGALFRKCN
jgi:hypothetical protein